VANQRERKNRRPAAHSISDSLVKVTVYVRPDQVIAIDHIQLARRIHDGKRIHKYELWSEALDLLIKKHKKDLSLIETQ
jgi:hypothetical protein